jgi:hypothetical protein
MAEQANLAPKQGYGSARGKAKEVEAGYDRMRRKTWHYYIIQASLF